MILLMQLRIGIKERMITGRKEEMRVGLNEGTRIGPIKGKKICLKEDIQRRRKRIPILYHTRTRIPVLHLKRVEY